MIKKLLTLTVLYLLNPLALTAVEKMVVLNFQDATVNIIETQTDTIIATLTALAAPSKGVYDPVHHRCYITDNVTPGFVTVVDMDTDTVIATIATGNTPFGIAIAPELNKIFVAMQSTGNLNVISTETNTVISTISIGTNTADVLYVPSVQKVYIANQGSHSVSIVNAVNDMSLGTITISPGTSTPRFLTASCDQTKVFVSDNSPTSDKINVISTSNDSSVQATITVGTRPRTLSINCNSGEGFIPNQVSNSISVIETFSNSNITSFTAAPFTAFVSPAYSPVLPSKNAFFVSCSGNGRVYIGNLSNYAFTTELLLGNPADTSPYDITFNSAGSKAYVANFSITGNNIFVIDTGSRSFLYPITVGFQPAFIIHVPDNSVPPSPPQPPTLPLAPINLLGSQFVNTYLTQKVRINQITWQAPTSHYK